MGKRGMSERHLFGLQARAHHLEFTHELCEQRSGLGEILGLSECLELDTELAHSPYAQVPAGAIQLVGHARQRPGIPLLARGL
jgi:hypothetical protein